MDNTIGNIQLQQQCQQRQIWEAHLANYRSPVGVSVLQNGQLRESSVPMSQRVQASSTLSPSPLQVQGGSSHRPIFQQHHHRLLANGSPSSSKVKPHQNQQFGHLH
ncbi:hypothetical protein BHM03_00011550 [Ensete ventricosum]|nr:hypothetical protein BHM03_00011550 [Ensete ventricosum]